VNQVSTETRSLLPVVGLVFLLAFSLAVRLGWAGMQSGGDRASLARLPDQLEYYDLAASLASDNGLRFHDERFGQDVVAYRTPGYPVFLAATGPNVRVARIVQAVIDASTVLAAYLLARRWLGQGPSLFAAAMVGVNPFLIYFSGLLLTETLFTALLAWGVVGLTSLPRRDGGGAGAWAGLIAGAACLAIAAIVRPSALPLAIALPLVMPNARWRTRLGTLGVTVLFLAALFGPWAARNQRLLGRPILATTNGGITLYDGFNPVATGASDQSFVARMPELREMSEVERSDYLERLGWRFIRERPGAAVRLAVSKLARTWSPIPLSAEFGQPVYRAVAMLYAVPLYVLVVVGLWRRQLPWPAVLLLVMPAVYFSAVHMMSVGSLRYRVPVEPLLCVFAGAAIVGKNKLSFRESVSDRGISIDPERLDHRDPSRRKLRSG
jgi:4-amino-4-deoxy-L-arabinose transferase-like glycosyltransferase